MKTIILSILLFTTQIFASVATITAIKGKADIQRAGNNIPASLGASLNEKDRIITQDNTKLQIIFKDETIISIGENSTFSINEYLFEDQQEPVARFGMLKGAMRTITGKIGKIAPQKFSVKTKTATIGIRGTNFTLVVGENDSYQAYCTYGAISVTISGSEQIINQGFFITVSPNGKISKKAFTPKDLKEMKDTHFSVAPKENESVTKNALINDTEDENNEQLNITINNDTEVIVADVNDNIQNVTQSTGDVTTYIMNNASYAGDYTVTSDDGVGTSLGQRGATNNAKLNIDFGADTAELKLFPTSAPVVFDLNPSFTDTGFTVEQTLVNDLQPDVGQASGTFSDSTGNTVDGTFTNTEGATNVSSGTYTVESTQVLY